MEYFSVSARIYPAVYLYLSEIQCRISFSYREFKMLKKRLLIACTALTTVMLLGTQLAHSHHKASHNPGGGSGGNGNNGKGRVGVCHLEADGTYTFLSLKMNAAMNHLENHSEADRAATVDEIEDENCSDDVVCPFESEITEYFATYPLANKDEAYLMEGDNPAYTDVYCSFADVPNFIGVIDGRFNFDLDRAYIGELTFASGSFYFDGCFTAGPIPFSSGSIFNECPGIVDGRVTPAEAKACSTFMGCENVQFSD